MAIASCASLYAVDFLVGEKSVGFLDIGCKGYTNDIHQAYFFKSFEDAKEQVTKLRSLVDKKYTMSIITVSFVKGLSLFSC